ncbi:MAG TPA: DUF3426 domain-containing protein [Aliidongia sp.]|nr:DUF3426 domain-containing protein [Aliidongia sp.]
MILSCPACATRYIVDPASLGAGGRKVRCAKCGETWYQEPPPPEPVLALIEPELPSAMPVTAPAMVGGGTAVPVDEPMPTFIGARPLPPRAGLPALPKKQRVSGLTLGWAALILFVALVVIGGWLFAPQITHAWPASARLYAALGKPAPDSGLELRGTNSARGTDEGGVQTVIVTGEIANISDGDRDVPKLRLSLRNAKGEVLKSMDFPPPRESLKPGESTPYQASIPAPEDASAATSAYVSFVR